MPKVYQSYAQNIPKICWWYAQDVPKMYQRYAIYISNIFQRNAQDMSKLLFVYKICLLKNIQEGTLTHKPLGAQDTKNMCPLLLLADRKFVSCAPFGWLNTIYCILLSYWLTCKGESNSLIGLNTGGFVTLFIILIVECCRVSPETLSQLDHLKIRASKSSQKFRQCIFRVPSRRGYIYEVVPVMLSTL